MKTERETVSVILTGSMTYLGIAGCNFEVDGVEYEVSANDKGAKYNLWDQARRHGTFTVSDVLITDNHEITFARPNIPCRRRMIIERHTKIVQQMLLAAVAERHRAQGGMFNDLLIPTFLDNPIVLPTADITEWVVKPQHGARGLGQVLLQSTRQLLAKNVAELHKKMGDASRSDTEVQIDGLSTVGERRPGESVAAYNENGVFIQEYINNIYREYRLLVTPDEYALVERERRPSAPGSTYLQATGCLTTGHTKLKVWDRAAVERDGVVPYGKQMQLINELGIQFGSVDLFETHNAGWGIFEWSNEFGVEGIDIEDTQAFLQRGIASLCKRAGAL